MTIEQGIYAHLIADSGVSALVASRVYPLRAPQNPTTPYVIYTRISSVRQHHLSGASGLANPRFQIDVFGTSLASAKAVADAIRASLDGFAGDMGSPSVSVGGVTIVDERGFYEDDTRLFQSSMDFSVWHDE